MGSGFSMGRYKTRRVEKVIMKNRMLMTLARYLHPRGAVSFWHTRIGPVYYSFEALEDYYIDLSEKNHYKGPYDRDGIPLLDYFGSIGRQYNPCAVAQWGLGAWQQWQRGNGDAESSFRCAVEWLRSNLSVDDKGRGFWWYRFDFDAYGLRAPWASALAQAQGISLLLRAYKVDRDEHDLERARQACAAMLSPIEEGGLLREFEGYTVLEEVVADRPTAILDGIIFAIFGLQDFCFVVDDADARETLERCYRSLALLVPRYDLGYWSRADLYSLDPPMPASIFYHRLHVAQLKVLSKLRENPVFADYAQRWEAMLSSPLNRTRALGKKMAFKFLHY